MKKILVLLMILMLALPCFALQKNVASQKITCFAWDVAAGAVKTGDAANIDGEYSLDGASQVSLNDTLPTEIGDGLYEFDLTQAETFGDKVAFSFVSTTTDIILNPIIIYTDAASIKVDRNADLIESQRGDHTWQGNYYYVDPVNGDTHANGNRGGRNDPYLTIQDCHDNAVTDSKHDVIFLVAGAPSGVTTHTVAATTTLSKRYLQIRGPGRDFIITRTGNGDTIEVTADGIGLSGFQLGTAVTGAGDGVQVTDSDFFLMENCWILETQGDGIQGTRVSNMQIRNNHFEGTGVGASGEGIHIDGTGAGNSIDNVIADNHFADTGGDAILIENGTIIDTSIQNNTIHGAGGWGVNISSESTNAIMSYNILGENTSGDIQDNGVDSILVNNYDTWDETLTGSNHALATSAGRRLREINSPVVHTGTSLGSNAATYINLASDASAIDGNYDPGRILIESGTGEEQTRQIMEYDGTLQRAYIKRDWKVIPDATSDYIIFSDSGDTHVNEGVARGGSATTIILNTLASAVDDTYNEQTVFIVSGGGQDQARAVTDYDGGTQTAMVATWQTNPDATSVYVMLPLTTSSATADKSLAYMQLLARSDSDIVTDRATELAEINADEGSGAGNFGPGTDSLEAAYDAHLVQINSYLNPILQDTGTDGVLVAPTGLDLVVMSDIAAGKPAEPGSMNLNDLMSYFYAFMFNETQTTSGEHRILDRDEATVKYEHNISDDGTTFTREEAGVED